MQMQGDRTALLNAIATPMVGMMQQIGIKQQDQAQTLVQEVVMPTLTAHYDELLDIQARSFAAALGKDDLQAIAAFYATPAGKRLVTAQPQLAQAQTGWNAAVDAVRDARDAGQTGQGDPGTRLDTSGQGKAR